MKKLPIIFFICLHVGWLYGQKQAIATPLQGQFSVAGQKTQNDTLDSHFIAATPRLYASPNGGYVSGNSGYGETGKLQEFHLKQTEYKVAGFLFWFAKKTTTAPAADSSQLILIWHDMDSAGTVYDSNRVVPRTLWAQDTLLLADIDTSSQFGTSLHYWPVPVRTVDRNHAVGFRMHRLAAGDSVALWSSSDGDPPRKAQSWEHWNGSWRPIWNTWSLDIDLAIFPVLDLSVGLENESEAITIFPNPSTNGLQIQRKGNAFHFETIQVLDAQGKYVKSITWPQGGSSYWLSMHDCLPGTYLLVFEQNGNIQQVVKIIKQP